MLFILLFIDSLLSIQSWCVPPELMTRNHP